MQSIFGFYYVVGLLSHMGWPRRRGLFSSEAVVDSLILDSSIEQMIDWSASIGACRPKLALQIIASMFRDMNWESGEALDIGAEISDLEKQWVERGNTGNPRADVKPVKFSKTSKVISMNQLQDKDIQHALEVYFYESLMWGLANPDGFKDYFSDNEKRQKERLPEYITTMGKVDRPLRRAMLRQAAKPQLF